jgi:hypothetical protein
MRTNTTSSIWATVSPRVAAVVSAPEVIADWLALSVAIIWACTPESCSALSCSGPVLSQFTIVATLVESSAASAGTPRTKVATTKVSTPPSAARPPTITSAVARPRGTPCTCSRWTAGESSAASSSATATGTMTAAR